MRYLFFFTVCLALFINALASPSLAQSSSEISLKQPLYAIDATHIKQGALLYHLWGTRLPSAQTAQDEAAGQAALQALIGDDTLTCFTYTQARTNRLGEAQCFNEQSLDLSEELIKQGLVLADRSTLIGTNHENAYFSAESTAQAAHVGLWRGGAPLLKGLNNLLPQGDLRLVFLIGFGFFVIILAGIIVAAFLHHRSFDRIHLALNQNIQMISREAKVRQRELELVAVMIHAELKTNQSKIEAFLVIYEDLLKTLSDPYADHKYLRSGEIVRSAPALERSIYDANISKLDALGEELLPRVVSFYGQIETDPPYNDLTTDMTYEDALKIVKDAVENARQLNSDVNTIIGFCEEKGFTSVNLMLAN